MALISCPECEKEISDKVAACPHCGYPLVEQMDGGKQEGPQPVAVTSVQFGPANPEKRKKIIAAGICVIVVAAISVGAYFGVSGSNAAAARIEYIDNLTSIRTLMLSGAAEAEELGNLTRSVWSNTIQEESDSETDKYTKLSGGFFRSDFNASLAALRADKKTQDTVSSIEANQALVSDAMKMLQNPAEEFNACYSTVDSMYEAYQGMTGLATSPSGSLTSFSTDFRAYDTDFIKYYDKLETQIPDE